MIAVVYASTHGATQGIAHLLAERLDQRGLDVRATEVNGARELDDVDAVILGSAVYAGSWKKEAVAYAERHAEALQARPVWLFSSGPLGEAPESIGVPKQLDPLMDWTGAREHRVFAGALDPGKLNIAERLMAKAVKAPAGDFRDPAAINAWADAIADQLERERVEAVR